MTLAEFAKRYSPEAEALATLLARDLLGVESDEMSMLYFVDYVKSGTGLMNLISDFKDGGQYLRNRQGKETTYMRKQARVTSSMVFFFFFPKIDPLSLFLQGTRHFPPVSRRA